MSDFNATYGRFGIDIARRLLKHTETTANTLVAHDIELPTAKVASRIFNLSVAR